MVKALKTVSTGSVEKLDKSSPEETVSRYAIAIVSFSIRVKLYGLFTEIFFGIILFGSSTCFIPLSFKNA